MIQAFKNLAETLKAAGCTFDDIIDVTTFHTDPERQFESIMKVKIRSLHKSLILIGPLWA